MIQAAEVVAAETMDEESGELTYAEAVALALRLATVQDFKPARQIAERVLEADPDYVDALNVLGYICLMDGELQDAVRHLRRAVELAPNHYSVLNNLGNTLIEACDIPGAVDAYKRAIKVDRLGVDAYCNLAAILNRQAQHEIAEEILRHVLSFAPEAGVAHMFLSDVLADVGRNTEAQEHFYKAAKFLPKGALTPLATVFAFVGMGMKKEAEAVLNGWIESEPDNPAPRHMLAGLSGDAPERAPDAYVEQVFDRFAGTFDAKLASLKYRAPELVGGAVARRLGEGKGDMAILDAGCGTGLCAEFVKGHARRLEGVDLSTKMLVKAARIGLYDDLDKAELTEYMAARPGAYDVVISADTLCYFGRLDEVSGAAASALRPGGVFVFSVEEGAADQPSGYSLAFNGRYQHAEPYVRAALEGAGFRIDIVERVELRLEALEPVKGLLVTATVQPV